MQNQYFADKRDFFKYDFLLALMEGGLGLRQFLFVPMLTPDDGSTDGTLIDYQAGDNPRRRDLWDFLRGCLSRGERDIRALRRYMKKKPFEYIAWRDGTCFTHNGRQVHFSKIPDSALRQALVYFDPDNGFEVPSMTARNGEKYLRYAELAEVFSQMDDISVAVIYQHIPRKNRDPYFFEIAGKIRRHLATHDVSVVSDNTIAFFVVSKSSATAKAVRSVIKSYSAEHDLRYWETGQSGSGFVEVIGRLFGK